MTLQELKSAIETKTVPDDLIIFKCPQESILTNMYIDAIAKSKNLDINYVESPNELTQSSTSIFGIAEPAQLACLNVVKSEVYVWGCNGLANVHNAIIVVQKFQDKDTEKQLEKFIITIPALEDWQVQDYVYSMISGVDQNKLAWMMKLCGTNYFRLQSEIDKLKLFREDEQKYVFDDLVHDGEFSDLSSFNIFNLTNALSTKNMDEILSVYRELDRVDVNEFGLLTILVKNFRNIIMVQLSNNPTPESTGMSSGQLYAIKKLPKVFSPQQLVNIYEILLDIDRQIKNGELPAEIVIDYMLIKILSV